MTSPNWPQQSSGQGHPNHVADLLPPQLADVALIDAATFAAARGCSLSSLHELVRRGLAPQPVIRSHRFTRWLLTDAKAFLIAEVERARADSTSSERITKQAAKASAAALAKRRASTLPTAVAE